MRDIERERPSGVTLEESLPEEKAIPEASAKPIAAKRSPRGRRKSSQALVGAPAADSLQGRQADFLAEAPLGEADPAAEAEKFWETVSWTMDGDFGESREKRASRPRAPRKKRALATARAGEEKMSPNESPNESWEVREPAPDSVPAESESVLGASEPARAAMDVEPREGAAEEGARGEERGASASSSEKTRLEDAREDATGLVEGADWSGRLVAITPEEREAARADEEEVEEEDKEKEEAEEEEAEKEKEVEKEVERSLKEDPRAGSLEWLERQNAQLFGIIKILCLLLVFTALFAAVMAFRVFGGNEPRYFAVSQDLRLRELETLAEPRLTSQALLNWASETVCSVMSLDFLSWRETLQNREGDFTREGFASFIKALESGGHIQKIETERLALSAALEAAPVIVGEETARGRLAWTIELPILLSYQSSRGVVASHKVLAEVEVERVKLTRNPKGVVIKRLVIAKKP
ncbi:MAG: DotI/IcmL family type IV secretion protein [Deltaproteobacteria bacterium]|jgi:intracellular multiplication protein IcmL|nr:DotI/IcmL family type IV secretion protein [Deltaproteobacteria bacterium]